LQYRTYLCTVIVKFFCKLSASKLHVRIKISTRSSTLNDTITAKKMYILIDYIIDSRLFVHPVYTNMYHKCHNVSHTMPRVFWYYWARSHPTMGIANFLNENNVSQLIGNLFCFVSMATSAVLFFSVQFHHRIRFRIKITDTLRYIPYYNGHHSLVTDRDPYLFTVADIIARIVSLSVPLYRQQLTGTQILLGF
jgi:hypothetical protein